MKNVLEAGWTVSTVCKLACPPAETSSKDRRADRRTSTSVESCSLVTSRPADEWQRWVSLWRVEVSDSRCAQSMMSETRWGRALWLEREQDRQICDINTVSISCMQSDLHLAFDHWKWAQFNNLDMEPHWDAHIYWTKPFRALTTKM